MTDRDDELDWDFDAAFDDDYLHFYQSYTTDELNDSEASLIAGLADLRPGERVLDVGCGTGRIANRLAALGAEVLGVDRTSRFLELAREDAAARGVATAFRELDMRELDESGFDAVVCWFTVFGYFDDAANRDALRRMFEALRPGGRILLETLNLVQVFVDPNRHSVKRVGADVMIDEKDWDPMTGRQTFHRTVIRDGKSRSFDFFVRLFTLTELEDWLRDAGFVNVTAHDETGDEFHVDASRMIVLAHRPGSA